MRKTSVHLLTPFKAWTRPALAATLLAAGIAVFGASSAIAGPAPVMFGYVPLPTDNMQLALKTINAGAGPIMQFTVGITNAAAGSTLYYDHWEDGYEADIANPVQASTLVFGDGIAGNGDAATYCGATCAGDLLPQGAPLIMQNNIPTPRNSAVHLFDGGDKVASTRGFAITAGGFTTATGSLLATVVSAYDTSKYSTDYTAPVGTDTAVPAGTSDAFAYSGLLIQAAKDGTVVQVDTNGDGTVDNTQTIDEGKTMLVNGGVLEGATVHSTQPVMVHEITGDPTANYESRTFNLVPDEVLWNDYMSPVGSSIDSFRTINFLYNPNAASLTVTPTCTGCSGTLNVPANAGVAFASPSGQAVRFKSTGPHFIAVAGVGSQSGAAPGAAGDSSSAWDWGYTLLPTTQLTTQVVLGWAPGNSNLPPSAPVADRDDNPVWITTLAATDLFVDFDGDPSTGAIASPDCFGAKHDVDIPVAALASTRVFDPNDGNMTGARIYTCDGTPVAGAWGEDPANAPAGSPGFDAGYTLIPTTTMLVHKSASLANDSNNDGKFGPGDTMTYVIEIADAGSLAFTSVKIADTLPPGLSYVAGSTVFDNGTAPAPIADDGVPPAATVFPLDESGASLPNIGAGKTVEVRFDVAIDNPFHASGASISNTGCVTAAEAAACDTSVTGLVAADLALTKVITVPATHAGDNVTFRVTVDNSGPDAATGVGVTDLLPTGLTFVSANPSQGTYDAPSGLWSVGALANGANATLDITATVTVLSVANVAQVSTAQAADPDSQPAENPLGPSNPPDQDDEATVTVTVAPGADLSLTKTVTSPPAFLGDNAVFAINVTNDGPSPATGVAVSDPLPAGLVFVSSAPSQGSYSSTTGVWTIGTLPAGSTATITITVRVLQIGAINNVAEVSSANEADPDSTPANGSPNEDDRGVATVNTVGASIGDRVWDDVNGDGVQDAGEPGLSGVGITLRHDADDNGTFETLITTATTTGTGGYGFADLLGGSYQLVIDGASLPAGYTCTNCLAPRNVVVAGGQVITTADYGYRAEADLALVKTVATAPTLVGDTAVFQIVVSNSGPATATGVQVLDALPAGVTYQSSAPSQGSYVAGTGLWSIGSIASGASATLSVTVLVTASGPVTNTAEVVAADQPDPDSQPANHNPAEDDQDAATISASPVIDLALTKTVTPNAVNVGGNATFTVSVTNDGPSAATGVVVGDHLPAGLSLVSAAPTSGTYTAATGAWTVGGIPAHGSATLVIVATVTQAGAIENTAEVTAAGELDADSQPAEDPLGGAAVPNQDDEDAVTIGGVAIDLSLDVNVSHPTIGVGGTVSWVVTVTNGGPSPASGVKVEDALPAGLTLTGSSASQGSYNPASDTWSIGALPVGAHVTLTLTTRVDRAGAITDTAQVSAANEPDVDSTPANSVRTEDDQDSATVTGIVGALGGTVWVDSNRSGTIDTGEARLPGVTVQLLDVAGRVVGTDVTDANGDYSFPNVVPGSYLVVIVRSTLPSTVGAQVFDPDAVMDGRHIVVVAQDGSVLSTDFGYNPSVTSATETARAPVLPRTGPTGGTGPIALAIAALALALPLRTVRRNVTSRSRSV